MKVGVRTIRVIRTEASEDEWAVLRQLVAEGLTVVDTVTPLMAQVAAALDLQVREPAKPESPPARRGRPRMEGATAPPEPKEG